MNYSKNKTIEMRVSICTTVLDKNICRLFIVMQTEVQIYLMNNMNILLRFVFCFVTTAAFLRHELREE